MYSELGVRNNPRRNPRRPIKQLELTQKQQASVINRFPMTRRIFGIVDNLKTKKPLSESGQDFLRFGTEWLLYYKQQWLDIEEEKKSLEIKSPTVKQLIDDAKKKVMTFINKDPASLSHKQADELLKSQVLLKKEGVFDKGMVFVCFNFIL